MLLLHSLLLWVSGTSSAKKANRESRPIAPRPLKEQRACGINQNAKHNNEVPWEREPCDCLPACTPLGDGSRGARPTAPGGALFFLACISPPDVAHPFTAEGID